tara:strand:+ start:12314 stop:13147 length:834 start_codon:yes stop_codon:yes gene_type:complete
MKKFGILGNPLSHSLSPAMHSAAIKHLNLNLEFEKWEIPIELLEDFFLNLEENEIIGGCVTIPFKEKLFNYCSDLDDSVKRIGAINWFRKEKQGVKGFNTDYIGFYNSLPEQIKGSISDINIVVIGAGGSSKAVVESLLLEGSEKLSIINRTLENANNISSKYPDSNIIASKLGDSNSEKLISDANLIVNTTSLGMISGPNPNSSIIDDMKLNKDVVGFDLVYSPLKTPFLIKIENSGGKAITGISMLIHQAIEGLKLIAGENCPYEIMEKSIISEL